MSDTFLARFRAGEGIENDIANAILDALTNDEPVTDAVVQVLLDSAIERYQGHIAAMLRRGGFDVEDGEPITIDLLMERISAATGLELDDLSIESITSAVDSLAAERLSSALGIDVSTVMDTGTLLDELEAGAVAAFADGASGLVSSRLYNQARNAATWARLGVDKKQVQNVLAQRKYRQSNIYDWD